MSTANAIAIAEAPASDGAVEDAAQGPPSGPPPLPPPAIELTAAEVAPEGSRARVRAVSRVSPRRVTQVQRTSPPGGTRRKPAYHGSTAGAQAMGALKLATVLALAGAIGALYLAGFRRGELVRAREAIWPQRQPTEAEWKGQPRVVTLDHGASYWVRPSDSIDLLCSERRTGSVEHIRFYCGGNQACHFGCLVLPWDQ